MPTKKPKPKKPKAKPVPVPDAKAAPDRSPESYSRHRDRMAGVSRAHSKVGREVGPLPAVVNPARKDACCRDFRLFNETYLKTGRFPLPWSPDHLVAISKIQAATLDGGQFANAMPRGSGKTSLAEAGVLWALLYGHRVFVALIGAEQEAGKEMLQSVKMEIETNDLLAEDFPEVCYLVRELEGINNRANGQTLNGVRTRMVWTDTRAVFPTVKGSPSSGARLKVAGLTGRIRGMKGTTASGKSVRPDLAIVDDPQTDESAFSPSQNAKRENILNGAVMGLAGPKKKIACFVPCTVIAPGDMADRILDRQRNPVWHGERSKMVVSWPADREKWDQYADLRKASQREGGSGEEANEMYRQNQAAMDAGSRVSWPEKFNDDEISGIQHAMNLLIDRGSRIMMAEYQNDPQPEALAGKIEDLSADVIAAQVNRCPRGMVPPDCSHLVAGIDVQEGIIFYALAAFCDNFTGAVIDYGTCPRQNRAYFRYDDARPSLADLHPNHDVTARIYAGLGATVAAILGQSYPRQGGGELRVELAMIDTGHKPDTVYSFCRESPMSPLLMPYRGYGVTAKRESMERWALRPGEKAGWNWRKSPVTGSGRGLHVIADVNHWKSFVAERFLTPAGGVGRLALFGEGKGEHQLFADHVASEQRFRMADTKTGRVADEWAAKTGKPDNHWWDCLVMCAVAASVMGVQWSAAGALGVPVAPPAARPRVKLSDLQRQKREQKAART